MSFAELHSAFVWDCRLCSRENFMRAADLAINLDGAALVWPRVRCTHCGQEFESTVTFEADPGARKEITNG